LVRRLLIDLLYQPQMIDDDKCGAVGGMRIDRGNRSTRSKPTPVSLCPSQIPHNLTWARTPSIAVGSRRLTARAMARPRTQFCNGVELLTHSVHHNRMRIGSGATGAILTSYSRRGRYEVCSALFNKRVTELRDVGRGSESEPHKNCNLKTKTRNKTFCIDNSINTTREVLA
jgi:hypothetical protein